MNIDKKIQGDVMTITIDGWLDTAAAPDLEAALNDVSSNIKQLVFDCKNLDYISSSGIRQIVAAHKQMNGNMCLKNVSKEIMSVLNMTGISNRIRIE